ncbi:MAG: hypothetical protein Q4Q25_04135 [Methanocorpusculum sp.]|nr:hypothetical protein [Methanocorpusculum sp.]
MKKSVFWISAVFLLCGISLFAGNNTAFSDDSDVATVLPEELYGRGVTLFFEESYGEAKSLFQQSLDQDPENPAYHYFFGLSLLREGDTEAADASFLSGAQAEYTSRGRLVDVPGHLRRIQGEERVKIEKIRSAVGNAYKDWIRRRQEVLYGNELEQQRRVLAANLESVSAGIMENPGNLSFEANGLPSVPPIRPFATEEIDGYLSEELASYGIENIIELKSEFELDENGNTVKDENGEPKLKVSLSTAEQKRLARKEQLEKERAAAKENFVDVLGSDDESGSGTTFAEDDKDRSVSEAEESESSDGEHVKNVEEDSNSEEKTESPKTEIEDEPWDW